MPMILEGLVTTTDVAGKMHVAAMGQHVCEEAVQQGVLKQLSLLPFRTSQTAENLLNIPEGVFHLVDDVLLLANIVTHSLSMPPACRAADEIHGWVLADACRAYEFRVEQSDRESEREHHVAAVVAVHDQRPFIGFNRAKHAVVEAAILVTRMHLVGADVIQQQLKELAVLVHKTGGRREHEAWNCIESYVHDAIG